VTFPRVHLLVPNLITLGRMLAVPVIVWLIISDRIGIAFALFVAAGLSDALDGYLAKQFDARSVLGGYLDPFADKALLVSVFISLGYRGELDQWLVILVVSRDAFIIFGVILWRLLSHPVKIAPLMISKVNTVAQILLAATVMARAGLGIDLWGIDQALVYLVAATACLSGGAYLVRWGRVAAEIEEQPR